MFEKFFVWREQNVNKVRCVAVSRMVFLHQKAVVIVLLSACLYRKASMCIHCLLCYVRVCASICNYTSGSVESLSLETVGRRDFSKSFIEFSVSLVVIYFQHSRTCGLFTEPR